MEFLTKPSVSVPFSVIVPVTQHRQLDLNISRSPGLKEVNAEIIQVEGARSAAEAFEIGSQKATHAWRVMAHQDVYFPVGSGFALAKHLGILEQAGATLVPVGFAGLEKLSDGTLRYAGVVIDRTSLFSHQPSAGAVSMDEFAVALHRDAAVKPDRSLGWHLWATDLCIQAERLARQPIAQILDLPLFHNSTNDYRLPDAFHESGQRLLDKYPDLASIPTLCGLIERKATSAVLA